MPSAGWRGHALTPYAGGFPALQPTDSLWGHALSACLGARDSGSIGLALSPEPGIKPAVLTAAVDAAMYSAKRAGKGCIRYAALPRLPTPQTGLGQSIKPKRLSSSCSLRNSQQSPQRLGFVKQKALGVVDADLLDAMQHFLAIDELSNRLDANHASDIHKALHCGRV